MARGLDYVINLITGDFGGASKAKSEMQGLDNAVADTHKGLGGLKNIISQIGPAIGVAFAVGAVVDFGKKSFEVYEQTAQAQAQIVAGIKSTAGAAGLSLADLTDQADKLAHISLFSEDQIENAQAIALSFTNVKGAIFKDAIPAIEDMATRMGQDLPSVALQVGKALQDPIHGVTSLQRMGVRLSDSQKQTVKSMVEMGNSAGAQAIILKELGNEFGGSAEAARKAKGAMGDLAEQTHDLKEGFGKLINEGLEFAVPLLLDVAHGVEGVTHLMADCYHWVKDNAEIFKIFGLSIAGVSAAFLIANPMVIAYGVEMGISALVTGGMAVATGVLTAAQWALNVAMDANPIGIIIVGIGALITLVVEAYEHCETFRAILAGIGEVASELTSIFKGLGEIIIGAFSHDAGEITKGFSDAYNGVKNVIAHGGISGAFMHGAAASLIQSHKDEAAQKKKDEALKTGTATDLVHHGKETPYAISTGKRAGKTSGDGSTTLSGGRSVRNVQVTIGKLVERLEIHTTNLQGIGAADIKRQLTELLTGAVHDSEMALGSQ